MAGDEWRRIGCCVAAVSVEGEKPAMDAETLIVHPKLPTALIQSYEDLAMEYQADCLRFPAKVILSISLSLVSR